MRKSKLRDADPQERPKERQIKSPLVTKEGIGRPTTAPLEGRKASKKAIYVSSVKLLHGEQKKGEIVHRKGGAPLCHTEKNTGEPVGFQKNEEH